MGLCASPATLVMGRGPHLQTAEFVPETHPIRLWSETFPWDAMVHAVEQSFARRFPKKRPTGWPSPGIAPGVVGLGTAQTRIGRLR